MHLHHDENAASQAAAAPTGDRATRKVRAVAAQHRAALGNLRHVEAATPNAPAWATTAALVLLFSVGPLLGNASVAEALWLLPVWVAIAGLVLWFLGSEKLLVLDRGVVVGSFAPFLRPFVVPFSCVEATSVRAVVGSTRAIGALLADRGVSRSSRTVLWSRRAVTFVGPSTVAARRFAEAPLDAPTSQDVGADLWVFSARSARRQETVVRALAAALDDAHVADVEQVLAHALPARRLTATPAGADHLRLPERWRSAAARHTRTGPHATDGRPR
ncbi:hypothetical protein GCM10009718_23200 [Isoptericola halotolerans]|uniref:PH (Pleckstrin Homology) domain-containing protein n=1 Tax=Isoptericola halotolerans TaxID=300560 RepID=A0ABX2A8X7_9MICO|nr:hypothetical protein [Isoptericola halotolerans]NOV98116.1 hypothetical protein [Isoptericola halotolerans]